jgi:3-oxoacyl-[acyl-carrier-protein] synthase-3
MGTRIDSVVTMVARRGPLARGALGLADDAARACLEFARREPTEIDLLVNAGLYKEKHLVEPALASIIQEDIGANPGHPAGLGVEHGTFSFDVQNGGCGALTAAWIIDGFARSGSLGFGLVVASDSDPSPRTSHGYGFARAGAAMLLEAVPGGEGFDGFELRAFPELGELYESCLRWEPGRVLPRRGHNALVVTQARDYAATSAVRAASVVRAFLDRVRLLASDVDVLVATPQPAGFADAVARDVGIDTDRISRVAPELETAHTAGMLASLEAAMVSGRFRRARNVLFIALGAGVNVGVALYRVPEPGGE